MPRRCPVLRYRMVHPGWRVSCEGKGKWAGLTGPGGREGRERVYARGRGRGCRVGCVEWVRSSLAGRDCPASC
eukprot:3838993-Rhodomonas_salina.2